MAHFQKNAETLKNWKLKCTYFFSLGRFVPWDILSLGTFCPLGRFVLGTFCPWDVLSLGTFCPWDLMSEDVLSWDVLSLGTFCLGTFCLCTFPRCSSNTFVALLLSRMIVANLSVLSSFSHFLKLG